MADEYTKFIFIYNDTKKIVRIKGFEDLFNENCLQKCAKFPLAI